MGTKLILCIGAARSGTTWSFNVLKSIVESNSDLTYSLFSSKNEINKAIQALSQKSFDFLIFKTHSLEILKIIKESLPDRKLPLTTISVRDPLNTILSNLRIKNKYQKGNELDSLVIEKRLKNLNKYYTNLEEIIDHSENSLIIKESIIRNKEQSIEIIRTLYHNLAGNETNFENIINKIASDFSIAEVNKFIKNKFSHLEEKTFSHYDKSTHFHSNHISTFDYDIPTLTENSNSIINTINSKIDLLWTKNSTISSYETTKDLSNSEVTNLLLKINIFNEERIAKKQLNNQS